MPRYPVYPVLFAVAFVLLEFTIWWPPALAVLRPMTVLVALTIVIQLVASQVLGSDRGGLLTALLVMALLEPSVVVLLIVMANGMLLVRSARARALARFDWGRWTGYLNFISVAALVTTSVTTIAAAISLPALPQGIQPAVEVPDQAPDIYLVLLDAYPRSDTLESELGFDNSRFITTMQDLGFEVAVEAHSNYNRTALTVPSLLNAAQIDDVMADPPGGKVDEQRWLSSLVNRATAVRRAQAFGYAFIHVPTSVAFFTPTIDADVRESGRASFFETGLLAHGVAAQLFSDAMISWRQENHRGRILDAFEVLGRIATEPSSRPRLVFAHIQLPHHPFLFASDGSLPDVEECSSGDCQIPDPIPEPLLDAIRGQVEFTNSRAIDLTRRILTGSSRPTVIVFFSDHGFRHWMTDKAETFRSLLLYSAPGHPGLFPQDSAPVNLIPRILNAYVGAGMPLAREDLWITESEPTESDEADSYFPLRRSDHEPSP